MIGIDTLVYVIVYLLIAGIICWLLYWLIGFINPPEPFKKVATVILAVAAVLVVIGILLSLVGHPLIRWGP